MARFTDLLDRKVEDFQRPANLPIGHYTFQILKHPEITDFTAASTGTTFDRVTFICVPVAAEGDVDADELEAYGDYASTQVRKVFLIADGDADKTGHDRSMFNLRQFLSHCGVSEDASLGEALAASVNCNFIGALDHRPDPKDPEIIYQEIGRTAAAD